MPFDIKRGRGLSGGRHAARKFFLNIYLGLVAVLFSIAAFAFLAVLLEENAMWMDATLMPGLVHSKLRNCSSNQTPSFWRPMVRVQLHRKEGRKKTQFFATTETFTGIT